ncbi:MAG: quinolinate synthase NadA [Bacteroidales bacterium]|nr:quinolinate synthase NadA [Bacteroidales bacterium]
MMLKNTEVQKTDYVSEINRLKKEKNAVLLAHYYQVSEIQEIADYVGDSLGLARKAEQADAEIIVFAGVHFMAETAKIINPDKKVLLPDETAGCSLAESAPADEFEKFVNKYPDHMVISYVNCTAAVKTMTDLVVTSGNAVKLVDALPKDQKFIFAPDKNLGAYINNITGRNMLLWEGTCEVHDILNAEKILKMQREHSDAKLVAHPECKGPVLQAADFVGSTSEMLKFTKNDDGKKYIVATETGLLHQMQKDSPDKEFMVVPSDETCACNDCPHMKKNTMEKLYLCLKNEKPEIELSDDVIEKARKPIDKMLKMSKDLKIIK